jgi:hypothetical protein
MAAVLVAGVLFLVLPGRSGVPVKKVALQANSRSPGKGTSSTTTSTSKSATGGSQQSIHINVGHLTVPAGQKAVSAATAQALLNNSNAASGKAIYTATYQVTKGSQVTSFSVAQDPPDSKLSVSSQGISITGYNLSSGSYECFEHSASAGSSGISSIPAGKSLCIKSTQAISSSALSPATALVNGVQQAVSHISSQLAKHKGAAAAGMFTESTKTVLGMQMTCLNIAAGVITYCFNAQGIIGYISGSTGGGTLQLTSYSTSVPPGTFTLPSTPVSQSSLAPPSAAGLPPTGSSSGG